MAERTYRLGCGYEDAIKLYSPERISELMPPELRFRATEYQASARILGQRPSWSLRTELREGLMRLEASPLEHFPISGWRLETQLKPVNRRVEVKERMEMVLRPAIFRLLLGGRIRRMIGEILHYREGKARQLLKGGAPIEFRDPMNISVETAVALQLSGILAALILLWLIYPTSMLLIDYVILAASWILLWFSTHCLAHHLVGAILGIRFTSYFIGLSNLCRIKKLRKIGCLMITLGIRVDRRRGKRTRLRMAAMYSSGALSSILAPALTVLRILQAGTVHQLIVFSALTAANVMFSLAFSIMEGDLRKAFKVLR